MKWTRETLKSDLLGLFKAHAEAAVEVRESSKIVGDLGLDSLGVMELVADIEDRFKITIPDETLREIETIADVAQALEKKLAADGRLEG